MKRRLTQEDINHGIILKEQGTTKRELADIFKVGQTTIWDNIFRKVTIAKKIDEKCSICEILLKSEVIVENGIKKLPFNYKLGDKCLDCVLRLKGVKWEELKDFGIKIYI